MAKELLNALEFGFSKPGMLLVITGRTGAGKDTILNNLNPTVPFGKIVTCATRKPREGEVDGVDYHFISEAEFKAKIDSGEMVEWVRHAGSYKGTTRHELLRVLKGENVTWRIETSRAGKLGDFFRANFEWSTALRLISATQVYLIDVPEDQLPLLEQRARQREGEKFDPDDYARRKAQEDQDIKQGKFNNVIYNFQGDSNAENATGLLRQFIDRFFNPTYI